MRQVRWNIVWLVMVAFALPSALAAEAGALAYDARPQINTYAVVVYRSYVTAHNAAQRLQQAIDVMLDRANLGTQLRAQQFWIAAREPYSQTEAFRFYEGPIDFSDPDTGRSGPEGRLNGWPLNEAYIDYVRDQWSSGIINDPSIPIDRQTLIEKNAADDEADMTTGYHAIEFLLWGQDEHQYGPGQRCWNDYYGNDLITQRRKTYLRIVTELLVDDLKYLVDEWAPNRSDNYRARFTSMDQREALGKILSGLATLCGFELASERLAVGLESGMQEDEQSCFSDNTHADFLNNIRGVANVYFGRIGNYQGQGIDKLAEAVNPQRAKQIARRIVEAERLAEAMPSPYDRVLASPRDSSERRHVQKLIGVLQELAQHLVDLGGDLGVDVVVAAQ